MKPSIKTGLAFGLTSGVITTLAVMIGLNAATSLKLAVIGGILTIAIADAFSDALSIHISQESSEKNSHSEVWEATLSTFLAKLLVALTFLIPIIFLEFKTAIIANLAWGLILIVTFNFYLAKSRNESPLKVISEHLGIAILVITITHFTGKLIALYF
jgi:vacuolar iron transporter family protein